jgi:hypothetical protein
MTLDSNGSGTDSLNDARNGEYRNCADRNKDDCTYIGEGRQGAPVHGKPLSSRFRMTLDITATGSGDIKITNSEVDSPQAPQWWVDDVKTRMVDEVGVEAFEYAVRYALSQDEQGPANGTARW